uniref:Homeobox domain-containing protein n=1 Tax=Phasianus colchicus TaxID=9054 RepID=A0A669QP18_PHACC
MAENMTSGQSKRPRATQLSPRSSNRPCISSFRARSTSAHQIQELTAVLGLTYQQVKTWFQNQRTKLKRCQKNSLWTAWIQCLMQNSFQPSSYLDVYPKFHQDDASNIQRMPIPCQQGRAECLHYFDQQGWRSLLQSWRHLQHPADSGLHCLAQSRLLS